MTLNGAMADILRYSTEISRFGTDDVKVVEYKSTVSATKKT